MTDQIKRPTFLTVLCILSFIGLGLAILEALSGLIMGPFLKEAAGFAESGMNEAMDEISSDAPEILPFIENIFGGTIGMLEHITEISLVNLLCSGIALYGVIMMWNLKKTGFFLYAGGKIVIAMFPLILIGSNVLTAMASVIGSFIAAAFIIMYAVNLKSMR